MGEGFEGEGGGDEWVTERRRVRRRDHRLAIAPPVVADPAIQYVQAPVMQPMQAPRPASRPGPRSRFYSEMSGSGRQAIVGAIAFSAFTLFVAVVSFLASYVFVTKEVYRDGLDETRRSIESRIGEIELTQARFKAEIDQINRKLDIIIGLQSKGQDKERRQR